MACLSIHAYTEFRSGPMAAGQTRSQPTIVIHLFTPLVDTEIVGWQWMFGAWNRVDGDDSWYEIVNRAVSTTLDWIADNT